MEKVFLTWEDAGNLAKELASKINTEKYTSLFGIPRGGINVAQMLCPILKLPIVSEIQPLSLVVDDIVDSGKTLEKYQGNDTAVLHFKNISTVAPTYFAKELNKWIVYPWEITDKQEDEGIQANIVRLLEYIGEDPKREGLKDTPGRFERAWKFWTKGYTQKAADVMKTFENPGKIDQLIIIPKIEFYSMCEHHLAPFYGQIHIGYVPNGKVLGVSKFARLSEIYARRLQIQERLTQQIADDIMEFLKPQGAGVVIRAVHLCMRSRGVEKQNAEMVTSAMFGYFRERESLRQEFLALIP